jgi:hypothetical protein
MCIFPNSINSFTFFFCRGDSNSGEFWGTPYQLPRLSNIKIKTNVQKCTDGDTTFAVNMLTIRLWKFHRILRNVFFSKAGISAGTQPKFHCNKSHMICQLRHFLNTLNATLNPICHLLALLGAQPILHVSRIWVNSPIYGCRNKIN